MKIVVFGADQRVGAVVGDRVVDLNAAAPQVPAQLERFIAAGPVALERAREGLERACRDEDPAFVQPLDAVTLRAPWVRRARIACAGGNFADHMAAAMANLTGKPMAAEEALRRARSAPPWGFFKVLDEVLSPDDELPFPARATLLDYEAEVAVVLARPLRDASPQEAADAIWGVTLMNDWSIRDELGAPPTPLSFNVAKNFDGAASVGPCIVVGELDPHAIDVELRVNGELRQSFNTCDMMFSFGECLAYLTRDFTFAPGDLLAGGTGTGTALDASRREPGGPWPTDLFLEPGDVVEIASPQIGLLRNRVVAP
jgi:2-keto-4-pentenoate hydratase/2-oxohepta-3-ene-1,7-dioic acid hydratase in catechol pathway